MKYSVLYPQININRVSNNINPEIEKYTIAPNLASLSLSPVFTERRTIYPIRLSNIPDIPCPVERDIKTFLVIFNFFWSIKDINLLNYSSLF